LIFAGLLLNYISEIHSFIRLGVHPPGNTWGGLPDLVIPIAAFYLTVAGLILFGLALKNSPASKRLTKVAMVSLLISVPLTILYYAVFFVGMQWIASGADRLGECNGLDEIAASSNDIPQSLIASGRPAVGCAVERYGMFLSFYNELSVSGVTVESAQGRILKNLSDYKKVAHTHPIRVVFYEKENWTTWRHEKNGVSGGQRGPENIIRVATLR